MNAAIWKMNTATRKMNTAIWKMNTATRKMNTASRKMNTAISEPTSYNTYFCTHEPCINLHNRHAIILLSLLL